MNPVDPSLTPQLQSVGIYQSFRQATHAAATSHKPSRIVACVLGIGLVGAAGLKLISTNNTWIPDLSDRSLSDWTSDWTAIAVGLELSIGCWLIAGYAKPLAWLAAFALFAILTGISGYLGMIGQANCHCFGEIETTPWIGFGIDIGALIALFLTRPSFDHNPECVTGILSATSVTLDGLRSTTNHTNSPAWTGGLAVAFAGMSSATMIRYPHAKDR